MKFWLLLSFLFISIVYASVEYHTGIVGTTKLNGEGCVCHNLNSDPAVIVSVEGPDSLAFGQTAEYTVYLSGGPQVIGGFNVAARFGALNVADSNTQKIDGELTHSQPRIFQGNQVSWKFNYTAGSQVQIDTIYSVALSANGDELPTALDKWNFGANFPVTVLPVVPVELVSFTSSVINNKVHLNWETATEINNKGFEVERKEQSAEGLTHGMWRTIAFIQGSGTITEFKQYLFIDENVESGKYLYRLKQVDFDGSFTYSNEVEAEVSPSGFRLSQNYPNPFNPVTKIKYAVPGSSFQERAGVRSFVTLRVYDILGNEIAALVNEAQEPGEYEIEWNASGIASGVYYYSLSATGGAGDFKATKKLILMK